MNYRSLSCPFALLVVLVALFLVPCAPSDLLAEEKTIPAPADVAAPPAEAMRTDSGLTSLVLSKGDGEEHPRKDDSVKVHYTGWTTDGEMFDSSVARDRPVVLPLGRLIPGWVEGIQLMVEGETRRMWIPEELAYKDIPNRPQGMLVFDVELLDILRVPEVPENVAAPPADAERSKSGLAWKVLRPGTGTVHPGKKSVVNVHYTGWTTDGERFDSSIERGTPSAFGLGKVIAGWTEGLQLMVEGEVRRFWIPKKIAYRGRPGLPEGMLVFEIELVEIIKQ